MCIHIHVYIHTCTEGMCTSTMYGSVQCDAYTHTYIHVLKCTCTSTMYGSVQFDAYTHTYIHMY